MASVTKFRTRDDTSGYSDVLVVSRGYPINGKRIEPGEVYPFSFRDKFGNITRIVYAKPEIDEEANTVTFRLGPVSMRVRQA